MHVEAALRRRGKLMRSLRLPRQTRIGKMASMLLILELNNPSIGVMRASKKSALISARPPISLPRSKLVIGAFSRSFNGLDSLSTLNIVLADLFVSSTLLPGILLRLRCCYVPHSMEVADLALRLN